MKNIIVFGASGGTGKYFVEYFKEHCTDPGYEVIAAGRRKTDIFERMGVRYERLDITDKTAFEKLPQDVFAVVDLAGLMPARMEGYNPYKYIDVNITGTLNILEYCRKSNADRILFAQSFGDIKDYGEDDPLLRADMPRKFSFTSDHTVYVLTKNFAVDLIENYHQVYGIKNFIFRLPNIYHYSADDSYYVDGVKRKMGWRIILDHAVHGEDIEVWGDPSRVKDMVYVKDFCQMMYRAVFVDRASGYYNVGTGVGTSLMDQIKGMIEVFGPEDKKSRIIMRPDKPNAPQYIMDISPAREELGYKPEYLYTAMLEDMKREMQQHASSRS